MKIRFLLFVIVPLLLGSLIAQKDYSPVVLYWKTLDPAEKELYLFSYLTQVYETHTSIVKETGRGEFTKWYYENRAEMVYNILDLLEHTEISKFIEWIDDFYRQDEFKELPFHEALKYAYIRSQAKGQTLLEQYESLFKETESKNEQD